MKLYSLQNSSGLCVSPGAYEAGDVGHRGQREASIRGGETLRALWMMRRPEHKLNVQRNKDIGPAEGTKTTSLIRTGNDHVAYEAVDLTTGMSDKFKP